MKKTYSIVNKVKKLQLLNDWFFTVLLKRSRSSQNMIFENNKKVNDTKVSYSVGVYSCLRGS